MKSLKIADITLPNRYILAPMAGVTDMPMRLMAREMGCGLLSMEMVSANALHYKNKATEGILRIDPEENPVSLQIFGSDPDIMAEAAERVSELPCTFVDINMGCPVPKIVKNGEGSALMLNPPLAEEIVRRVVRASQKPVTVKIRAGFDMEHRNAVEMAKRIENAGACMVAVHGRTRSQYYAGHADWDIIRQVKGAVRIPVIGNGDIVSPVDAQKMFEETGCDGVMIGRASRGNPWIFREMVHYEETGEILPRPERKDVQAAILKHARLMMAEKGEYIGTREMRKHVCWYTAGMKNSAQLRSEVCKAQSLMELREMVLSWNDEKPRI